MRDFRCGWTALLPMLVGCLLRLGTGVAWGDDSSDVPESLRQAIEKSERILVAVPSENLEVAPGKPFLVDVERALRGSGARGSRARIIQGGTGDQSVKYSKGRLYGFFLVRGPGGRGWATLNTALMEIEKGKIRWRPAEGRVGESTTSVIEELIDATTQSPAENLPKRDSLEGRWLVMLSERGADLPAWLVEFRGDGQGGYSARMLETNFNSATLQTEQVTGDGVLLKFVDKANEFVFQGRLVDGKVRGVVRSGAAGIAASWLEPTDVETLERFREPRTSTWYSEYQEAVSAEAPLPELLRFVRRRKDVPAVLDAYLSLLPLAAAEIESKETLKSIVDSYVLNGNSWGPELGLRARVDSAMALAKAGAHAEIGLEIVDQAEALLTPESPKHWGSVVRRIRGQFLITQGRVEEGMEQLRKVRQENAFDVEITWILAQDAQRNQRFEEALELLGEMTVLPGMEATLLSITARNELSAGKKPPPQLVPSRLVERVWKLLKRPEGDLPAYLDELYERKVRELAGEPRTPRGPEEGNRVVLLELFTGAQCGPCVGADVGSTAFEAIYSKSEAIVLRYHQHTPGPDPLASPESLSRFKLYGGEGVPGAYLNGRPIEGIGGGLSIAPDVIRALRQIVEPFLQERIDLKLDLTATAEGDNVNVKARALGLEEFPNEMRLNLALAEERIVWRARNGVRVHDMVVRIIPGDVKGAPPVKGQLEFSTVVDVAKQRRRLLAHLDSVEREGTTKFDSRPMDLTKLVLVAWLQNADTGEVLQAASVPVRGRLNPPPSEPQAPAAP